MRASPGPPPDPQPHEAGGPPANGYDGDVLLALLALLPVLFLGLDALAYAMRLPTDPSLLLASLATLVVAGVLAVKDADVVRRRVHLDDVVADGPRIEVSPGRTGDGRPGLGSESRTVVQDWGRPFTINSVKRG